MKSFLRSISILAAVATLGTLVGCGGGSNNGGGGGGNISVSVTATPGTIPAGGATSLAATLTNDTTNAGVTWSLSGPGSLSNASNFFVTYNGPSSVTGTQSATITATSIAQTSATGSASVNVAFPIAFSDSATTVTPGSSVTVNAQVIGDSSSQGVSWTVLSGPLSLVGQSAQAATFSATSVSVPTVAYVQATSVANSAAVGITTIAVSPAATTNTQYITVDGGPSSASIYPNGGFTSATICTPGSTTNCVTVDGLLVDTGSVGLRVLAGALGSVSLTPTQVSGSTLNNCVAFVDGSFLWGQVAVADVYINGVLTGGEAAKNLPIQVVADPSFTIPSTCNQGGIDEDNLVGLGANGIIGIGPEPNDCGSTCAGTPSGGNGWPYYACASNGCTQSSATIAQQVTNPIFNFSIDNNGSNITFPSVINGQPTTTGIITWGIGTQSNNALAGTVYTMDSFDNFVTNYNGQSLTSSFIDSGSNAYFFPDNTITACTDFTSFFCPSSTLNLSAQTVGATQGSGTVLFSIANTDSLFNNSNNPAYGDLGGPGSSGSFDWGMPFFFGRTTFTSIRGQTVSGQPATPWWAY